ncbi:MAG TPA: GntR family transcriptional regulator [Microbacteriaceae bacterium]|nr:GntR family transcriptional regulator [Microbacteriaceae bacterium]
MQTLRAPERKTSVDLAVKSLYVDILDGIYPPGSFLRLNEVADQMGMSMMPVREAIRELAAMGIVESIPHRGAQVRALTIDDLIETYQGRLHLETLALRLGAPLFGEKEKNKAISANQQRIAAVEHGTTVDVVTAHEAFHFELYRSCRNPWIVKALLPGWRNAERYRSYSMRNEKLQNTLDAQHGLLIDAMAAQDTVAAVKLLHKHLTSAAQSVASELTGSDIMSQLPSVAELLSISPQTLVKFA